MGLLEHGLWVDKKKRINFTWIVSSKPKYNISIVWHRYCVFERWLSELAMQQTFSIPV